MISMDESNIFYHSDFTMPPSRLVVCLNSIIIFDGIDRHEPCSLAGNLYCAITRRSAV